MWIWSTQPWKQSCLELNTSHTSGVTTATSIQHMQQNNIVGKMGIGKDAEHDGFLQTPFCVVWNRSNTVSDLCKTQKENLVPMRIN